MPTYEYACTACGHRLEAVQRFSEDPLTECPECGGALRKVYGAVGIVLKGSGFYKTDAGAAGQRLPAGSERPGHKGGEIDSAASGSSESPPNRQPRDRPPTQDAPSSGGDGDKGATPAEHATAAS